MELMLLEEASQLEEDVLFIAVEAFEGLDV